MSAVVLIFARVAIQSIVGVEGSGSGAATLATATQRTTVTGLTTAVEVWRTFENAAIDESIGRNLAKSFNRALRNFLHPTISFQPRRLRAVRVRDKI